MTRLIKDIQARPLAALAGGLIGGLTGVGVGLLVSYWLGLL